MKRILFITLILLGISAQAQDKTEALKKMEALRSTLSKAHQFMLTEDFASTGFRIGYIEAPSVGGVGSGITQPQGTAADKLKASAELPSTYTVWIQTADAWYVGVRKEHTAIFLKLSPDADGEMDFFRGSGWGIGISRRIINSVRYEKDFFCYIAAWYGLDGIGPEPFCLHHTGCQTALHERGWKRT